jgi:hypothetical protein
MHLPNKRHNYEFHCLESEFENLSSHEDAGTETGTGGAFGSVEVYADDMLNLVRYRFHFVKER